MKKILLGLVTLGLFQALSAATQGSCQSAAPTYAPGAVGHVVSLTAEYWYDEFDPADSFYDDESPVYYAKINVKKGTGYSVWLENATSGVEIWGVDQAWEDESMISASFLPQTIGGKEYYVLDPADWDADDASSVNLYIYLGGSHLGDVATIYFQEGVPGPEGGEGKPVLLTPATTLKTDPASGTKTLVDGTYYYSFSATAGRRYLFATTGGTGSAPLTLSGFSAGILKEYQDWASENNASYSFVPAASGKQTFSVVGSEAQPFALKYQYLPQRSIGEHQLSGVLAAGESVLAKPGHVNLPKSGVYDEIIDEVLYSFTAAKEERLVAKTSGATAKLLMRVYNAKGSVVATGSAFGDGLDIQLGFVCSEAGTYFLGLAEDLADDDLDTPTYAEVTLSLLSAASKDGSPDEWDAADDTASGATALSPVPSKSGESPVVADSEGHGPHALGVTDWNDTFVVGCRKDITYAFSATFADEGTSSPLSLKAEVFYLSGTKEIAVATSGSVSPNAASPLSFKATQNAPYYVRLSVAEGGGLDYPFYRLHACAYSTSGAELGILTVNLYGADGATWSLGSEAAKYPSGSSILVAGAQTVKYSAVTGFLAEKTSEAVTINPGKTPTVLDCYYNDTFDPKDNTPAGAVALTIAATEKSYPRSLWTTSSSESLDHFSFQAKDGVYYDFSLSKNEADAVFSITNATGDQVYASNVTAVKHLALPGLKTKYYLVVSHDETSESKGGSYTLSCKSANVGSIKFASNKVSAKKTAGTVKVTVNRTAKEGRVRVRYGTVAGTAKPGERYVAQNGILEWADGDNKAKTILITLLPDLVPVYGGDTQFSVELRAMAEDELEEDEYPAQILGETCVVTVQESAAKASTSVDAVYAKKAPKLAVVKTEDVPLRTGTFYGVLAEDGSALTNGLPSLASVTVTTAARSGKADTLTAKVMLAGKTYQFKGEGWDEESDEFKKTLELVQVVNKVSYTNRLTIAVRDGASTVEGEWLASGGTVELTMNVPDANGKGAQEDIVYSGEIFRQNAKIQGYLEVVTNFTGYYTTALASTGVSVSDGLPAGNGYLTVTIDNKGTAKVAGLLPDNTKVSAAATACAIKEDSGSLNGYAMYIPVYLAKSPYCFGGTLKLVAQEGQTLPARDYVLVVDSTQDLSWKNDNAKLTYYGEEGWSLPLTPCGGWYDTVINLQAYYKTYAFEHVTADISEFPRELLASGYDFITEADPNGQSVAFLSDALSVEKKSLVKSGKLYDFGASLNPCNVQVKLARASGLVTGSFSLWSVNGAGTTQKEITGFKTYGVLLLSRHDQSPLGDDTVATGFGLKTGLKISTEADFNASTGKYGTRSWNCTVPFSLLGADQGEPDWWADDWGSEEE